MYRKSGPWSPRTSLILTRYSPSAGAVKNSRESLPSSRWLSSSFSIVEREDRQAVGNELRSRRVGLDDVARLAQRVRERRGIEVAPAASLARIGHESGIGPARIQPELDDLAVGIQVFVEFASPAS